MSSQEKKDAVNSLYPPEPKKLDFKPAASTPSAPIKAEVKPDPSVIKVPEIPKPFDPDRLNIAEDDPGYKYGNILPIKKNEVTGERSLAAPKIIRDIVQNAKTPGDVTAGKYSLEDMQNGALDDKARDLATSIAFVPAKGVAVRKVAGLPAAENLGKEIIQKPPGILAKNPEVVSSSVKSEIFSPDTAPATTKPAATPRGIADRLYALKQSASADQHELLNWIQQKAPNVSEDVWEKVNAHLDDPEGVPLEPHEQGALEVVQKMKAEKEAINDRVKELGFKPKELVGDEDAAEDVGGATRQVKGRNTPMDRLLGTEAKVPFKERLKGVLGRGAPVSGRSLTPSAGSLKSRGMMAITDDTGTRRPVYVDKKGQVYDAAEKGPAIGTRNPDGSISTADGKKVKLGQATQKEIEAATKGRIQYHKNALGVEATSLLQSRRALRNAEIFDQITNGADAASVVQKASKAPKDWTTVKGFPNESKYKFEPKFAEEIEDFLGGMNKNHGELKTLEALNRFMVGAFFWLNPAHAYNVAEAFAVSKGAIAFARDLPGTAADLAKSIKSVATRDNKFMQQMRAGVPMRGMDGMTQKFNRGLLDAMQGRLQKDPQGFAEFAKAFAKDNSGISSPQDIIKRVGELSHDATFTIQDILQQTLERGMARKGVGQAQATEDIARTLPNYRIPSRVAGSRTLGKAAKGSSWLQFPGWDIGRLQGLGNMLKGAAKLDKKSLDQLLMIAVLYEFGKEVTDPLIQQMTGNKQAEGPTSGYGVFPRHAERLATGQETLGQAGQALFPAGYIPRAMDLVRGTDAYTGKHISTPGESPQEIGFDYLSHAASTVDPMRRALDMLAGKETPREVGLAQLGIKDPSPKEQAGKAKAGKYNRSALRSKRKKEPEFLK